ncbi:Thioredoxin-like protein CXXS1, partial [Linum grandiflorum]
PPIDCFPCSCSRHLFHFTPSPLSHILFFLFCFLKLSSFPHQNNTEVRTIPTQRNRGDKMESHAQEIKSNIVKVESLQTWDSNLSQAQASPVIVHFTASWCMPSVAMNPFFEELAFTYPDAVFLVVDVDELKVVADKLEVKAMPTFVLIKDGNQADKIVGANPEEIRKRVDSFIRSCISRPFQTQPY